MTNGIKPIF